MPGRWKDGVSWAGATEGVLGVRTRSAPSKPSWGNAKGSARATVVSWHRSAPGAQREHRLVVATCPLRDGAFERIGIAWLRVGGQRAPRWSWAGGATPRARRAVVVRELLRAARVDWRGVAVTLCCLPQGLLTRH